MCCSVCGSLGENTSLLLPFCSSLFDCTILRTVKVNLNQVMFACLSAYSQVSCPYSETNLNKEGLVPDRLSGERPLALSGLPPRGRRTDPQTNSTLQSNSAPLQTEGAVEPQNRFAPERTAGHVFTKQEQTLKARRHSYWDFCVPT